MLDSQFSVNPEKSPPTIQKLRLNRNTWILKIPNLHRLRHSTEKVPFFSMSIPNKIPFCFEFLIFFYYFLFLFFTFPYPFSHFLPTKQIFPSSKYTIQSNGTKFTGIFFHHYFSPLLDNIFNFSPFIQKKHSSFYLIIILHIILSWISILLHDLIFWDHHPSFLSSFTTLE